jgi:NarL family two-component system response regulator LiaR
MTHPVLVVDDSPSFREAARTVLDTLDGFAVVAEAASGEAALDIIRADTPLELVLMDVHLPGLDGIATTRAALEAQSHLVVVLLSTLPEAELPDGAADCGAAAYLPKAELAGPTLLELWRRAR